MGESGCVGVGCVGVIVALEVGEAARVAVGVGLWVGDVMLRLLLLSSKLLLLRSSLLLLLINASVRAGVRVAGSGRKVSDN